MPLESGFPGLDSTSLQDPRLRYSYEITSSAARFSGCTPTRDSA
ncbi:hypothetical protein [Candidatus Pollutiaquabacter sp.]